MPSDWADVETLMRELGSVRAAAHVLRAADAAKAAIEQAIGEATTAVLYVLDDPQDTARIARAHDAIEVVAEVIASLDEEVARSVRVRARGAVLRRRAVELIQQVRKASG
jgi:hypothetical protein